MGHGSVRRPRGPGPGRAAPPAGRRTGPGGRPGLRAPDQPPGDQPAPPGARRGRSGRRRRPGTGAPLPARTGGSGARGGPRRRPGRVATAVLRARPRRARPRGPADRPRPQHTTRHGGDRMSTPTPTGRREERSGRQFLVMERRFEAPIDAVWAAITEPERLARWIGTWTGDPASGAVDFRM